MMPLSPYLCRLIEIGEILDEKFGALAIISLRVARAGMEADY